jgi:dihydroorotase
MPPIRSHTDKEALIAGIEDGTIDAIAIDHTPQDIEVKKCEFENAAFGMRGLETAFGVYSKHLSKEINLEKWVDLVSHNPRRILDAPKISLNEGNIAELTLFKPKQKWVLNDEKIKLRSKNNPFTYEELTGKPFGIINKGRFYSA